MEPIEEEESPFDLLPTLAELRLVADALPAVDALAFAMTCTKFRAVTCQRDGPFARFPHGLQTSWRAMWVTVERLKWAQQVGCPLLGKRWCQFTQRAIYTAVVLNEQSATKYLEYALHVHVPLDVFAYLYTIAARDPESLRSVPIMYIAALRGRLDVMKWLHGQGAGLQYVVGGNSLLSTAALFGSLDMLKWLHANGTHMLPDDNEEITKMIAGGYNRALEGAGTIEGLEWTRDVLGCVYDDDGLLYKAAESGDVDVMEWLCNEQGVQGGELPESLHYFAAKFDRVAMLEWLRDNGPPRDDLDTLKAAAAGCSLEALKWLRADGCEWHGSVCARASVGDESTYDLFDAASNTPPRVGLMTTLEWLLTNGCPWDDDTTAELILWSKEMNGGVDEELLVGTIERVAEWLRERMPGYGPQSVPVLAEGEGIIW